MDGTLKNKIKKEKFATVADVEKLPRTYAPLSLSLSLSFSLSRPQNFPSPHRSWPKFPEPENKRSCTRPAHVALSMCIADAWTHHEACGSRRLTLKRHGFHLHQRADCAEAESIPIGQHFLNHPRRIHHVYHDHRVALLHRALLVYREHNDKVQATLKEHCGGRGQRKSR